MKVLDTGIRYTIAVYISVFFCCCFVFKNLSNMSKYTHNNKKKKKGKGQICFTWSHTNLFKYFMSPGLY